MNKKVGLSIVVAIVLLFAMTSQMSFAGVTSYIEITVGPGHDWIEFIGTNNFGQDIYDFTIEIEKRCSGVAIDYVIVTLLQEGTCGDWDVDDNESGHSQEKNEKDNEDSTPKSGKTSTSWYTRIDCQGTGDEAAPENKPGRPIGSGERYRLHIRLTGNTKNRCKIFIFPSGIFGQLAYEIPPCECCCCKGPPEENEEY